MAQEITRNIGRAKNIHVVVRDGVFDGEKDNHRLILSALQKALPGDYTTGNYALQLILSKRYYNIDFSDVSKDWYENVTVLFLEDLLNKILGPIKPIGMDVFQKLIEAANLISTQA